MSTYLLKGNRLGWFTLSEEQYKALEKRTELVVSTAAQELADWKTAMKQLKPEEYIVNSLARSSGIELNANDISNICDAVSEADPQKIIAAKRRAYLNAMRKFKGRKKDFLDRVFDFERTAMLSGPGTWIRNLSSNVLIGGIWKGDKQITPGLLDISEKVGDFTSNVIQKIFPKKKWKRDNQFKISGIKVTPEIQTFIKDKLIDSGLLKETVTGMSKYDTRKLANKTSSENLTDMICRSIVTDVFHNRTATSDTDIVIDSIGYSIDEILSKNLDNEKSLSSIKRSIRNIIFDQLDSQLETEKSNVKQNDKNRTELLSKVNKKYSDAKTNVSNFIDNLTFENSTNKKYIAEQIRKLNIFNTNILQQGYAKAYSFVFKMLSDDKYITRNMIKYLGKMLTEDNVDVSKGLTNKINEYIVDSYVIASQEYMHKSNFWNSIDNSIRGKLGPTGYFVYKQIFPFASTSWNWFMEGLKYTPAGLVKSIVDYAKLENTINKLDDAKQRGEIVTNSRLADYLGRRDIGKGVIGSVGSLIGILLLAFGVARLDEEDNKYKLHVADVTVDVTDLFGTQGIFFGMALTAPFVEKGIDIPKALSGVLDSMLMDSVFADVWNTVRYNETLGDYVSMLPMQVINNCVPNFVKTMSSISNIYKVDYSSGLQGRIERLFVQAVPGLAYSMPHNVDIYTGEKQIMYKAQFITNIVNKLSPFDIEPMNISKSEKIALELGINKTVLNGRFEVNGENVKLKTSEIESLNKYYGKLNKKSLNDLLNNRAKIKVKNKNGTYSELKYSQMDETQKAAAFAQLMSKNSDYAKIYILTNKGYKYYASDSEYQMLKSLGISKNVYRKTSNKVGFVK
jgi:hypothetical protein